MIINKRSITVEMTEGEYSTISLSLRKYVEHCHISLLHSQQRDNTAQCQIEFATKNFERALDSYESFSGRKYNIGYEELKLRERIPSLRKSF